MKLVPKLTIALVAGMCAILALNGYLRVRRETEEFKRHRLARHERAATAVGAAMTVAWARDGEPGAVAIMDAISSGFPSIDVYWHAHTPHDPELASRQTFLAHDEKGARQITWVPVRIDGVPMGTVELVESTAADEEHARDVMIETVKTAGALTFLSAVIAFVLGHVVVGTPVRALALHARRVGRGDFASRAEVHSNDELAELGDEMNRMTEQLVGTIEQLRHADRLTTVGKLASGIAHELGTPLNVVAARAEMIASGRTSPEESRDYARVILGANERMTRIIRQVLQFARRKGVTRATRDVAALVRDTAELLRPLAKKREVEIVTVADRVEAAIDQGQLQQVVTNLIVNAVQASASGQSVTVRVERGSEAPPADVGGDAKDAVVIVVEDHGGGIADENLSRIFEPFFTTKEVGDGTGLGLAVSYGIVREHGGWISVDSEVGRGSTFKVVLPDAEAA